MFFFFLLLTKLSAQSFEVSVSGEKIQVFEQNDLPLALGLSTYKFARIPYRGESLSVKITTNGFDFQDNDWSISPKRYKIEGIKSGNQLFFDFDRLGYVVIRFKQNQDFTKRLVLLFEVPEVLPEERVDIVESYGVDNTGEKNETVKIQAALDDISGSNKALYFPPGIYKSFKLDFRSNSRIHLSKNARLLADDTALESYISDSETKINCFLRIEGVENLSISGLGILDGNGTKMVGLSHQKQSKIFSGMRLILINRSKKIKFEGVILKDAARWNTHILNAQNVSFLYCKLMNNPVENEYLGSLDGWDPDSSSNVRIENCFGWAGDDAVAIKCTGVGSQGGEVPNVDRITVKGNVFLTKKTGLKIGTETRCALMQNIVFEDNEIIESDRVMGINVRDGALVLQVLFKNNYAEYCYPDRKQNGMNFYITKRNKEISALGKIQNVMIENCTFEQAFPKRFSFYRHYTETETSDLSINFKNFVIGGNKIELLDTIYFDPQKNNAALFFE